MSLSKARTVDSFNSPSTPPPPPEDGQFGSQDEEELQRIGHYGCGIDTHSKFIQVCVLLPSESGHIRKFQARYGTTWHELKAANQFAISCVENSPAALSEVDEQGLHYTIESTGVYHFPVLRAWEGTPHVVNPLLAGVARRKTDVLDAQLLAYHGLTGLWPTSYIAKPDVQILRVFLNSREDAQRTATRCTNRINNFILRFGHTFGALVNLRGGEGRSLVEALVAGEIPTAAGVCPTGLPEHLAPVITTLYEHFDRAVTERKEYEKFAKEQFYLCDFTLGTGEVVKGDHLETLLRSIPGFGPLSCLYWAAEVVTPTRFPNAKALAAYAGCDPSLKVSADKVTQHSRRKGNAKLHTALLHAAQPLIIKPRDPLGEWGHKIWKSQKKGGFNKATSAVARRMIEASWHVTRKNEPYCADKFTYFCKPIYVDDVLDPAAFPARFHAIILPYVTVQALADALDNGKLVGTTGVGEKCLQTIKTFLQTQQATVSSTSPKVADSSSLEPSPSAENPS